MDVGSGVGFHDGDADGDALRDAVRVGRAVVVVVRGWGVSVVSETLGTGDSDNDTELSDTLTETDGVTTLPGVPVVALLATPSATPVAAPTPASVSAASGMTNRGNTGSHLTDGGRG